MHPLVPLRSARLRTPRRILLATGLLSLALASLAAGPGAARAEEEADPAEVQLGERLFLETRFAEFFAAHASDVNAPLDAGDPALDTTETRGAPLPGPFAGQSMNCRACHLVDEQLDAPGGGMRTYGDFARHSPIPARGDGRALTPRNSPPLVNASLPRPGGVILHFDGEFESLPALVTGTLTGRNYGWLAGESPQAIAHIARVLREDDGSGELAQEFGGSYARVLAGKDPALAGEGLLLPPELRVDVATASDAELVQAVAALISAYTEQLVFARDEETGEFAGSAFDAFVARNGLPAAPEPDESPAHFAARLREAVNALANPVFVDDGALQFHDHDAVFGATELAGLRTFLAVQPARVKGKRPPEGGVGNCVSCHAPPAFTDFSFRNTGIAQLGFDRVHGEGRFQRLRVPSLHERNRHPERWLPASAEHPDAAEPFRRIPDPEHPRYTDLGVWNVFANPAIPGPQEKLFRSLCDRELAGVPERALRTPFHQLLATVRFCRPERLLGHAFAAFKTPGLRDLGHSAPYFHDGSADTLEEVLASYRRASDLARRHRLRAGDDEIARIRLSEADVAPLAAFLRALDEDYE